MLYRLPTLRVKTSFHTQRNWQNRVIYDYNFTEIYCYFSESWKSFPLKSTYFNETPFHDRRHLHCIDLWLTGEATAFWSFKNLKRYYLARHRPVNHRFCFFGYHISLKLLALIFKYHQHVLNNILILIMESNSSTNNMNKGPLVIINCHTLHMWSFGDNASVCAGEIKW